MAAVATPPRREMPEGTFWHELLEGQRAVLDELKSIRRALEHSARAPFSRADRRHLERILPAIATTVGSEIFLAHEVLDIVHLAIGRELTPRQCGRLLRRGTGRPIHNFIIERVGVEAGSVLWRVLASP